jgi:hypothetical protein
MARDLYDLEHLGRALQAGFDGEAICTLGVLKIYFDVIDEQLGRPLPLPREIFDCSIADVQGKGDLGHLRAGAVDLADLLRHCRQRYRALESMASEVALLAATCNHRDRRTALAARDALVTRLVVSR